MDIHVKIKDIKISLHQTVVTYRVYVGYETLKFDEKGEVTNWVHYEDIEISMRAGHECNHVAKIIAILEKRINERLEQVKKVFPMVSEKNIKPSTFFEALKINLEGDC